MAMIVDLHTHLWESPDQLGKDAARRILKEYRPHEGNFPREFLPYKREEAWSKMQLVFDARPDLAKAAENWKAYFDKRGS